MSWVAWHGMAWVTARHIGQVCLCCGRKARAYTYRAGLDAVR